MLHSFLTLALEGGEWSALHPACFTPWDDTCCHLSRVLGGPQSWCVCSGDEKSPLSLPKIEPWTFQLVA
jgi:hypothetical protein